MSSFPISVSSRNEEVGQVAGAFGTGAVRATEDHPERHAELQLRRIGIDVDEIALDGAAALEVDDGRHEGNPDAGVAPVHDRVVVERAPMPEPYRLHLPARSAMPADLTL